MSPLNCDGRFFVLVVMCLSSTGNYFAKGQLEEGDDDLDSYHFQAQPRPTYSTLPSGEELFNYSDEPDAEDRNYIRYKQYLMKKRNKLKRFKRRKHQNCNLPQPIFIGRRNGDDYEVPYGFSGEYYPRLDYEQDKMEQMEELRLRKPWQRTSWKRAAPGTPTTEFIPREPVPGITLYTPPPVLQKAHKYYYKPTTQTNFRKNNHLPKVIETIRNVNHRLRLTTEKPKVVPIILKEHFDTSHLTRKENQRNPIMVKKNLTETQKFPDVKTKEVVLNFDHRFGNHRHRFHAKNPEPVNFTQDGMVTVTPTPTVVSNDIFTTSQSPWVPFQTHRSATKMKIMIEPEPEIVTARDIPELPLLITKKNMAFHRKRLNHHMGDHSASSSTPRSMTE